jgi:hypothetical protein
MFVRAVVSTDILRNFKALQAVELARRVLAQHPAVRIELAVLCSCADAGDRRDVAAPPPDISPDAECGTTDQNNRRDQLLVAGFSGARIRPKAAEMWGSALDGGPQRSDGGR